MMNLLKKSASMASGFAPEAMLKQSLTALLSLEVSRISSTQFSSFASDEPASGRGILPRVSEKLRLGSPWRGFHVSAAPLEFRASSLVQAEFAVDDFYDDDKTAGKKSGNSEEGLEIAKLGIAQEIVDALAKKGISKLFPIQTQFQRSVEILCIDSWGEFISNEVEQFLCSYRIIHHKSCGHTLNKMGFQNVQMVTLWLQPGALDTHVSLVMVESKH